MNHDITWCNAHCATKDCIRNQSHIKPEYLSTAPLLSWAEFWKSCPAYQPKENSHEG